MKIYLAKKTLKIQAHTLKKLFVVNNFYYLDFEAI